MKKSDFEGLLQSVREAGQIARGEISAAREFVIEPDAQVEPVAVFAVCVETDDPALLVPRKIYEVTLSGEHARVIDEAGEAAVYPASFFFPITLPEEVAQVLARL